MVGYLGCGAYAAHIAVRWDQNGSLPELPEIETVVASLAAAAVRLLQI